MAFTAANIKRSYTTGDTVGPHKTDPSTAPASLGKWLSTTDFEAQSGVPQNLFELFTQSKLASGVFNRCIGIWSNNAVDAWLTPRIYFAGSIPTNSTVECASQVVTDPAAAQFVTDEANSPTLNFSDITTHTDWASGKKVNNDADWPALTDSDFIFLWIRITCASSDPWDTPANDLTATYKGDALP